MDYKKEICPVCLKEFIDGDDIVVCPECGTPHHRECWALNNSCANASLHGSEFEWQKSYVDEPFTENPQNVENNQTDDVPFGNTNAPFSIPVVEPQDFNENNFENLVMRGVSADRNEYSDGMRIGDIALYIQQNARNYIKKFIKNRKVTINWAALLFAPAWFFYRKLYKAGAIFLALTVAVSLFTYPLGNQISAEQQELYEAMGIDMEDEDLTREEVYEILEKTDTNKWMGKMRSLLGKSAIWIGLKILPNIIAALCANEIYRRKIKKDLGIICGATEDISAKHMLIMQRGGISFLWGALVFVAADYIVPMLMSAGNFIMDLF